MIITPAHVRSVLAMLRLTPHNITHGLSEIHPSEIEEFKAGNHSALAAFQLGLVQGRLMGFGAVFIETSFSWGGVGVGIDTVVASAHLGRQERAYPREITPARLRGAAAALRLSLSAIAAETGLDADSLGCLANGHAAVLSEAADSRLKRWLAGRSVEVCHGSHEAIIFGAMPPQGSKTAVAA